MRATFFCLAAFATLLVAGSMVPDADAADPAPADTGKSSQCLYGDAKYGLGAVICVAPGFGQICGDKDTWGKPTSGDPFDRICARAQTSVPGVPPAQCIYHDVKYGPNARICVAPGSAQICGVDGTWGPAISNVKECDNAQVPAPTYPAPPASK